MEQISLKEILSSSSGRLTIALVTGNVLGGILMPVLLAGVGYLAGWVLGGIIGALMLLCPFFTVFTIAYKEDYLCLCFYKMPIISGTSEEVQVENAYESNPSAIPYSPDPRHLDIPRARSIPHIRHANPRMSGDDDETYEEIVCARETGSFAGSRRAPRVNKLDITQEEQFQRGIIPEMRSIQREVVALTLEPRNLMYLRGQAVQDNLSLDALSITTMRDGSMDRGGTVTSASRA